MEACPAQWGVPVVELLDGELDGIRRRWVINDEFPGVRHNAPDTCTRYTESLIYDLRGLQNGRYTVTVARPGGAPLSASVRHRCRYSTRIYPIDEIDCEPALAPGDTLSFTVLGSGAPFLFVSGEEVDAGEVIITLVYEGIIDTPPPGP